jgi:NAD(P)-dependent dehydrogenase (short-subunit alcohol dehydrogenase family)
MIINVTSIGAVRGAFGNGSYSAAKGAMELATEALRKEVEP